MAVQHVVGGTQHRTALATLSGYFATNSGSDFAGVVKRSSRTPSSPVSADA